MRAGIVIIALGLGISATAQSASKYAPQVQTRIHYALRKDSAQRLKAIVEEFNRQEPAPARIIELAKKNGLSAGDTDVLKNYLKTLGRVSPKATWKDQAAILRSDGNEVRIGHDEFLRGEALINGKRFKWDAARPAVENLNQYDRLFDSPGESGHGYLRHFLKDAVADDIFRIKAAGLFLYFTVGALGEKGGQLDRLNAQIKEMANQCETPEPAEGEDDPFLASILSSTLSQPQTFTHFEDCESVQAYSKISVGEVMGSDGKRLPIFPRMPADLCASIDRLSKCVTKVMEPDSVTSTKEKKLPRNRTADGEGAKRDSQQTGPGR